MSNAKFGSISAILWLLNAGRYVNMSIYLYFTENMVMTRKIGFKSLIFQSVSMAMIYGFSGSDLEPVSSNSFDIVDLMIIIGMCILIPYND